MQQSTIALRRLLGDAADLSGRSIHGAQASSSLGQVRCGTGFGGCLPELAGRTVLLVTTEQLSAGLALIELDGVARRIVLCPPDLQPEHLTTVVADAGVDALVTDCDPIGLAGLDLPLLAYRLPLVPAEVDVGESRTTEWVMLTSGTTGAPKMVIHSRAGLTGAITRKPGGNRPVVWGTFYDIRRYGGLQIFFRALLGTGSLVLSSAGEDVGDHLRRLAGHGVTHQSGTSSHWRRVLMSPDARIIDPDYVRLSGEVADQNILDSLRKAYPRAEIGHAYASTEAGVGFEVTDGLEGFPAALMDRCGEVEMKVEDGSLRIRSIRTASRYVGAGAARLADREGFVDTDDMVERRGDRYYFNGRRSGVINVGGLKVHPEEVEAVINRHGRVRMSLVKAKANPITGSIVVADVVLNEGDASSPEADASHATLKNEILQICRDELPQHKVPVLVRFIPELDVTEAGKLARPHA